MSDRDRMNQLPKGPHDPAQGAADRRPSDARADSLHCEQAPSRLLGEDIAQDAQEPSPSRNSPATLADALRALPQTAPQPDLWPDLAQALAARRRRPWRHYALPAALAAAVALFVLTPLSTTNRPDAPSAPSEAATKPTDAELDALHKRSQALERWIAAATVAPVDSRDLMAAVEVEDLIGLVDVQLGATRGDADALPLWRQRVALLEDLASIRVHPYAVAAN